jgi:hypothetical protein
MLEEDIVTLHDHTVTIALPGQAPVNLRVRSISDLVRLLMAAKERHERGERRRERRYQAPSLAPVECRTATDVILLAP